MFLIRWARLDCNDWISGTEHITHAGYGALNFDALPKSDRGTGLLWDPLKYDVVAYVAGDPNVDVALIRDIGHRSYPTHASSDQGRIVVVSIEFRQAAGRIENVRKAWREDGSRG